MNMFSRISLLIALFIAIVLATTVGAQENTPTPTPGDTSTPTITPTMTPTFTPEGERYITVTAIADGYINAENPDDNYGTSRSLRLDQEPDIRSYLRFDTSSLDGTMLSVRLRIYANSGSKAGFEIHEIDEDTDEPTDWNEETLLFSDAPAVGALITDVGAFGAESWIEVDLSEYITDADVYDLILVPLNNTAINLSSLDGDNPPELVIDFTGEVIPSVTPTITPTRRPTRTATPEGADQTEEADS